MFEFRLNILSSLFLRVAFAVISLLTISFLSGVMQKTEFGEYNYYFSIYSLCLIPFTVGFSRFNVRFLASMEEGVRTLEAGVVFDAEIKIIGVMLTVSLLVLLFLYSYSPFSPVIMFFLMTIPFVAIKNVIVSLYRGMGHTFYGNFDGLLLFPLLFIIVLYFSHKVLSVELLAVYNAMVFLMISIGVALIFYVSKCFLFKLKGNTPVFRLNSKVLVSIALFTVIGALDVLNMHLDIAILGGMSTVSQVAEYKVSTTLKSVVLLPMQSFMLFIPFLFSKYCADNSAKELQKNIYYLTFLNVLMVFVFLVLYLFWGEYFIRLLFSDEYLQVKYIAMILIASVFISSLFGPAIELLIASGYEKLVFRLVCGVMLITVIGNVIVAAAYGALGVAFVSGLSMCLLSMLGCYAAFIKTKLNTSIFWFIFIAYRRYMC